MLKKPLIYALLALSFQPQTLASEINYSVLRSLQNDFPKYDWIVGTAPENYSLDFSISWDHTNNARQPQSQAISSPTFNFYYGYSGMSTGPRPIGYEYTRYSIKQTFNGVPPLNPNVCDGRVFGTNDPKTYRYKILKISNDFFGQVSICQSARIKPDNASNPYANTSKLMGNSKLGKLISLDLANYHDNEIIQIVSGLKPLSRI